MERTRNKAKSSKRRGARAASAPALDVTPERLAKSEPTGSEFVNPAEIDSSEQPIGRTRRFRDSWVDRLRRRGQLTYAQWFACDWYAHKNAFAFASSRVVADYGQSSGGAGGRNPELAISEVQADARKAIRRARLALPESKLRLFDAVVLDDAMPSFLNGRQRERYTAQIANSAQTLAVWLMIPGT